MLRTLSARLPTLLLSPVRPMCTKARNTCARVKVLLLQSLRSTPSDVVPPALHRKRHPSIHLHPLPRPTPLLTGIGIGTPVEADPTMQMLSTPTNEGELAFSRDVTSACQTTVPRCSSSTYPSRNLKLEDVPNLKQSTSMHRNELEHEHQDGKPQGMGRSRSGSFATKAKAKANRSKMKLFQFSRNTHPDMQQTSSTFSSSSPPPPKSTSDGHHRSSFPRRSLSRHRRKTSQYLVSIKPRIAGLYTPSLPPELWAEILRFAGASVDVDLDFRPSPSSLSSSSSSSTSGSTPTSFLIYQQHHGHLSARLDRYNTSLKFKAGLTRVCRLFHWLAQEVLYEHVWIAKRKEGRLLAGRLCGDGGVGSAWGVSSVVSSGGAKSKKEGKKRLFEWLGKKKKLTSPPIAPPPPSMSPAVPRTRMRTTSASSTSSSVSPLNVNVGHFIRRLHVETPSLDKCSPHDLLIILQYSTRLEEFFDYRSVQRPMHPLALSASDVVPFSSSLSSPSSSSPALVSHHPILTPDALLDTLFSRPLKRLSWTNYDHHPMDVVRGVRYYENVVGPRLVLEGVGKGLEFLEISTSCSEVLFGNGGGVGWGGQDGVWGVGRGVGGRLEGSTAPPRWSNLAASPALGINSMILTDLTASYTTTTTTSTFSSLLTSPSSPLPCIDGHIYTLVLPSLLSLKVTLDNATFTALSKWDMPRLTHLSVISADFGYAAEGFRTFFEVHGWKILQLELGHSSEDIEEAWVTSRPPPPSLSHVHPTPNGQQQQQTNNDGLGPFSIPLDRWCPGLHTFICSADAEWNWQSPDWIAPHVLLPTHAGLEIIGVRDMERRLKGDANDAASRRRADAGAGVAGAVAGAGQGYDDDNDNDNDDPYFMLFEQFGSLLRKEAFPSLKNVVDMSRESDAIRRSGSLSLRSTSSTHSPGAALGTLEPPTHRPNAVGMLTKPRRLTQAAHMAKRDRELAREQGRRVVRFWTSVLERCAERGVMLMNWRGEEVTLRSLGSPLIEL